MSRFQKSNWVAYWPWLLLVIADAIILLAAPVGLRYGAALILLAFLSGWVWLKALSLQPPHLIERLVTAMGLSLALTIISTMLTVYLVTPLTWPALLTTINGVIVAGLALALVRKTPASGAGLGHRPIALLLLIIIIAGALRLPRLGYAELHEDEAEALMLGVRLFQGEDYAIFLHRKGPAQMLLPVAFWLFTGRITEAMARFPFALSSILSVAALYFVGRRWYGSAAGLIAALLWAINGYAVGFGRMVQYQALIFFLGPLAITCLTLGWQQRQPRWLTPAAILLATTLLAHFDALLLLPAAVYLLWLNLREPSASSATASTWRKPNLPISQSPQTLGTILLAVILFLTLLSSFYIPYFLDPEFANTAAYLSQSRIKPGLLYNNLELLQGLDKDYSSRLFLPLVSLGLIFFVVQFSRHLKNKWAWLLMALIGLSASTIWFAGWWHVGALNLALAPWLLAGATLFWFATDDRTRAALLLFGGPFMGYTFLVDDPRTHLYVIYPGAIVLAGAGWKFLLEGWKDGRMYPLSNLPTFRPSTVIRLLLTSLGLLLTSLIIAYTALIFLQTESAFQQTKANWASSVWAALYDDLPDSREYFGYPKREGWKAIGALRAEGRFPGDFRSVNEDFIVPIWYNFGQARSCYNTPAYVFVRASEAVPPAQAGYVRVAEIQREGEARLHIYSMGQTATEVESIGLEPMVAAFDRRAT
ncbi:MAG: glycosyltransferase family 39 protein, partial [Anaerolineae bacterium]|nr:glycosyltransferase family 39 protein [Anaerolineae bacterium]